MTFQSTNDAWRDAEGLAPPVGHNAPTDPGSDQAWCFNPEDFIRLGDDGELPFISAGHLARFETALKAQGARSVRLNAIDNAHARVRASGVSGSEFRLYSAICDWSKGDVGSKEPRCVLMSLARVAHTAGLKDERTASKALSSMEDAGLVVVLRWLEGKSARCFCAPVITASDRMGQSRTAVLDASKGAQDIVRAKEAEKKRRQRASVPANFPGHDVPTNSPGLSPQNDRDKLAIVPAKSPGCPGENGGVVSSSLGSSEVLGSSGVEAACASAEQGREDVSGKVTSDVAATTIDAEPLRGDITTPKVLVPKLAKVQRAPIPLTQSLFSGEGETDALLSLNLPTIIRTIVGTGSERLLAINLSDTIRRVRQAGIGDDKIVAALGQAVAAADPQTPKAIMRTADKYVSNLPRFAERDAAPSAWTKASSVDWSAWIGSKQHVHRELQIVRDDVARVAANIGPGVGPDDAEDVIVGIARTRGKHDRAEAWLRFEFWKLAVSRGHTPRGEAPRQPRIPMN